ncbi:hypothetical protein ACFPRL_34970 [Pseudoclavibacter helvolus]
MRARPTRTDERPCKTSAWNALSTAPRATATMPTPSAPTSTTNFHLHRRPGRRLPARTPAMTFTLDPVLIGQLVFSTVLPLLVALVTTRVTSAARKACSSPASPLSPRCSRKRSTRAARAPL